MRRALLWAAAALLSSAAMLASAPWAHAQPYRGARLHGLNMTTASGAAEAAQRIDRAARLYCGMKGDRRQAYADRVTLTCRRDLTERTIQHIGAPMLDGAWRMRGPPMNPMG